MFDSVLSYYIEITEYGTTAKYGNSEYQFTKEEMNMGDENNKALRKKPLLDVLRGRIEQLCKEKGMSYYTLSYKSTIPLTTLLHITEGSTKNPGIYTIMKICDGLDISMKDFFDTKAFEDAMGECD